ncbi:MAG: alpha/beta fold hydrolase [Acidimicrobiales bacterium]
MRGRSRWRRKYRWTGPRSTASNSLTDRHRVLTYNRAGYGASGRLAGPVTVAQLAGHARSLMRHAGIERAHVVGHSSSARIALAAGHRLPRGGADAGPARIGPAGEERIGGRRRSRTLRVWPRRPGAPCGPAVVVHRDRCRPGHPAGARRARRKERADVRRAAPAAAGLAAERRADLPDATHLLHVEQPRLMAEGLTEFFARHPLPTSSPVAAVSTRSVGGRAHRHPWSPDRSLRCTPNR